ncbi:hypothetical protein [Crassaminicella thermophila]|uniref:hypothetical protein n=1 Tax=Crassaminicella thermophila TaxID=2599308 RepID=UPI001A9BEAE5|nr:hypothetical protein [Crassaminicella thermophila]
MNFKQGHIKANFLGNTYEIFHHSGGRKGEKYSVFSQEKQIRLIHRSVYREFGADKYIGEFDYDTNLIFNIFIMLYIEIVWNTADIVTNFNSNSYTYEWSLDILTGRKLDENWRPKKNI